MQSTTATSKISATSILRYKQITERLKLSRSTIHRLIKTGQFVTVRRLSAHAVGFLESDIDAWVASREVVGRATENETLGAAR